MRKLSRRTLTGLICFGVPLLPLVACSADDGYVGEEELGSVQEALTVTKTFQQGAASYTGSTDATVRQAAATTNYGAATTCEVDGDDGSGVDKSCFLRWSVSGLPSDAVVTSASITLRVTDSSANTYTAYSVSRGWNEGEVTWNRATSSTNWATPGALASSDRGPAVGTITGATGSRTLTLNAAGISAVQGWVNGASNNGIVIASASNTDGLDFASSEHGTASYRPLLSITYTTSTGGGGTGGSGAGGSSGSGSGGSSGVPTGTPQANTLIAFMGDQGNGSNADAVLNLIKNEGAQAVVHNGDFDYANSPSSFENRINNILGANFPYFAIIGNHDAGEWDGSSGYGSKVTARANRVAAMNCAGEIGVKANCNFRGVHLIESCIGVHELRPTCSANAADQVNFIKSSLTAAKDVPFKICNWHKNQSQMQTGDKGNEVGWEAYQACQNAGAIIMTGHEHSYERTYTLTNLGDSGSNHGMTGAVDALSISPGRTFVAVSGLGGKDIRDFQSEHDDPWWASTYASNRWMKSGVVQPSTTARYGALFIRFHDGGNNKRAVAYFKDVGGRLVDEFVITLP